MILNKIWIILVIKLRNYNRKLKISIIKLTNNKMIINNLKINKLIKKKINKNIKIQREEYIIQILPYLISRIAFQISNLILCILKIQAIYITKDPDSLKN